MPSPRRNLLISRSPFQLDNGRTPWLWTYFILAEVSVWHLSMVHLGRILVNKVLQVAANVKVRHRVHWCLAGVTCLLGHSLIEFQQERLIWVGLEAPQKVMVLSRSFRLPVMPLNESLGKEHRIILRLPIVIHQHKAKCVHAYIPSFSYRGH